VTPTTGRPTAAASLAGELRAQVLDGHLAPGTPLREEALAAEHGVSRHTVRSALQQLAAERLAETAPFRGVRVASLDDAAVRSLQDLRRAVESEAVRLLVERHGRAWPEAVTGVLAEHLARLERSASGEGDRLAVLGDHAALHHALVAVTDSARLTEVSAGLSAEVRLFTAHLRLHVEPAGLVEEHRAYLDDVRLRGPAAVHEHLAASQSALLDGR